MEDLHRNLVLPVVQLGELGVLDGNVLFNVLARQRNLFVLPGTIHGRQRPVRDRRRYAGKDEQEHVRLEATPVEEREEHLQDIGHDNDRGGEVVVGEIAVALCETSERGILYGGIVGRLHGRGRHGRLENRSISGIFKLGHVFGSV